MTNVISFRAKAKPAPSMIGCSASNDFCRWQFTPGRRRRASAAYDRRGKLWQSPSGEIPGLGASSRGGVEGHAHTPAIQFLRGVRKDAIEVGTMVANALADEATAGIKPGPREAIPSEAA